MRSTHGFSYIELLIVITILMILVAVAFGSLGISRTHLEKNLKRDDFISHVQTLQSWAATGHGDANGGFSRCYVITLKRGQAAELLIGKTQDKACGETKPLEGIQPPTLIMNSMVLNGSAHQTVQLSILPPAGTMTLNPNVSTRLILNDVIFIDTQTGTVTTR